MGLGNSKPKAIHVFANRSRCSWSINGFLLYVLAKSNAPYPLKIVRSKTDNLRSFSSNHSPFMKWTILKRSRRRSREDREQNNKKPYDSNPLWGPTHPILLGIWVQIEKKWRVKRMKTRKSPLGTIISYNRPFFIELFDRLTDILLYLSSSCWLFNPPIASRMGMKNLQLLRGRILCLPRYRPKTVFGNSG